MSTTIVARPPSGKGSPRPFRGQLPRHNERAMSRVDFAPKRRIDNEKWLETGSG
jgi:hypothetical protein